MSANDSERVAVAFITRAKGVRGEVFAELLSHSPERFDQLSRVVLQSDRKLDQELEIEHWRPQGRGIILKFRGIDTPENARMVTAKRYMTVGPEEVADLPDGMHYISQVVGCRVETEKGEFLGCVEEVIQAPSTDAYKVRKDDREFLVPAVKHFVVKLDVEGNRIIVRGIDDLLELK